MGNSALVAGVAIVVVTLLLLVLLLVLVLRRKKKQRREAREPRVEDKNPVYGMYFFAYTLLILILILVLILIGMYYFADGGHIDAGRSEVADNNYCYG